MLRTFGRAAGWALGSEWFFIDVALLGADNIALYRDGAKPHTTMQHREDVAAFERSDDETVTCDNGARVWTRVGLTSRILAGREPRLAKSEG